jgi:hypothetical protein
MLRSFMGRDARISLSVIALAGGVLVSCGQTALPENPTYEADIKPLVEAHCVRCHSPAGMLTGDPDIPAGTTYYMMKPLASDFTILHDVGTKHGLLYYTTAATVPGGAARMMLFLSAMPPPPAPKLTSWEHDLLIRWVNNPIVTNPSLP